MDNPRIIHAPMNGRRYSATAPITQYDYGYLLLPEGEELPTTYEIDFSNDEKNGTSLPVYGDSEGAEVPEELIRTGKDVFAFYYKVGDGYGKTEHTWRIPNKCRPSRDGETPTPSQQSSIDQLIVRSNEAVESAEQSAEDASVSAQSAQGYAEQAESARDTAQTYANNAQASATSASQSATASANSASASAQSASQSAQIKADVEDMVDDAQGYAQASAQSASASANSAIQASLSESVAERAKGNAQTYASQAQTSAQTASSKAQDASGYAQTASQKATEASQSATTASNKATEASGYATASQTAQGLAESARDSAQGYAEDAQGYAEDAQASAESISASASQIAQNTADIASLEDDRYKPYVTDFASGSIASFSDGADGIPLKSLVVDINPIQDLSNGDPSPENICPISGWTGANVSATGKNLLNPTTYGKAKASNYSKSEGTVLSVSGGNTTVEGENPILITNTTNWRGIIYTFTPKLGVTYRLSYRITGATNANIKRAIYICNSNDVVVSRLWQSSAVEESETYVYRYSFTVTESGQRFAFAIESSTAQTIRLMDLQIEVVTSADTSYDPYNGRTIPISWQSEAGTVYGGKLDVLTGKLTVYPYYASYNGETLTGEWISDRDVYAVGTTPTIGAQVVNIGAEGTEYQLTPQQVNSLLGANNIWADTGDASVEYRADAKLYIERLTAPDSADMIADSNIVSGQYFMVGNDLYKATVNIASGAQIVVGTNATKVSLSEALNQIKEA